MSSTANVWQTLHALGGDFYSGFSAMLHRCPPIQIPFMVSWLTVSSETLPRAFFLSFFFLSSTLTATLLTNYPAFHYSQSINIFAARHLMFLHLTAGVFTSVAVWQFLGFHKTKMLDLQKNSLAAAFLCLYWGIYFTVFENTACTVCPIFFENVVHASLRQMTSPAVRIIAYTFGHASLPVFIALFFVLVLSVQKLKRLKPSANIVFALALALFGLFFFLIA